MNNITTIIESFERKRFTGAVSCAVIEKAEKELRLLFSPEYKEVIHKYGFLCIKGEEFLGIDTENYDVVKATQKTRNASEGFPHDMYVIEKMAIDGILLLQKETGEIYTYQPNLPLRKVADSFAEYLLAL